MADGGFQLPIEFSSLLDSLQPLHAVATEGAAVWGHEQQVLPRTVLPDPLIAGAIPEGQEVGHSPSAFLPAAPVSVQPALSQLPPDPNRLDGVVIDWRESYGFVQFNDGRRAYVHNSMCGGSSLLPGQAITGICVPDTKNPGKWQAQQVQRKVSMTADGRMEGKVQQWTGNFGFIQFCDGRRAFCHSSFLTGAATGAALVEGQPVVGMVQEDPKNPGKWQAQFVEVLPQLAPDNSGRIEGKVTQWVGTCGYILFSDGRCANVNSSDCSSSSMYPGQTVFGNLVQDEQGQWQAKDVEGEPGRLDGVVTQWSDKGFGFIDFVDGRRAFVHNSACGGKHLCQGEAVSAIVAADQQNQGKWMARNVILKGCLSNESQRWYDSGKGPSHGDQAAALPPAADVAAEQGILEPSLAGLTGEIATLASSLGFAIPAISAETDPGPGGKLSGKVSEWNPSGFGFAMMDDGRRVYVHTSQCGGQHLQQGETIMALVVPDPRNYGKWSAQGVERLGGCLPGMAVSPMSQAPLSLAGAVAGIATEAPFLAESPAKRQRFGP